MTPNSTRLTKPQQPPSDDDQPPKDPVVEELEEKVRELKDQNLELYSEHANSWRETNRLLAVEKAFIELKAIHDPLGTYKRFRNLIIGFFFVSAFISCLTGLVFMWIKYREFDGFELFMGGGLILFIIFCFLQANIDRLHREFMRLNKTTTVVTNDQRSDQRSDK